MLCIKLCISIISFYWLNKNKQQYPKAPDLFDLLSLSSIQKLQKTLVMVSWSIKRDASRDNWLKNHCLLSLCKIFTRINRATYFLMEENSTILHIWIFIVLKKIKKLLSLTFFIWHTIVYLGIEIDSIKYTVVLFLQNKQGDSKIIFPKTMFFAISSYSNFNITKSGINIKLMKGWPSIFFYQNKNKKQLNRTNTII